MPAPNLQQNITEQVLNIVGGNKFGRYNKISAEQTFNMIVSDSWLVPYAGYKNVLAQSPDSEGRAIYASHTADSIFAVWGQNVYRINSSLEANYIGSLSTATGDVFIAENNNKQVAFTDYSHLYVYDYNTGDNAPAFSFMVSTVNTPQANEFLVSFDHPGYISFQNGRLIVVDSGTQFWYLSIQNAATNYTDPVTHLTTTAWPNTARYVGSVETKPDTIQACVPVPGGGNNLLVFGHNVIEFWQDVGTAKFPYQRQSTLNVDYGCLNASSIAALENNVIWLAANEQSGATIMMLRGNTVESISTDGMDFQLSDLSNPSNCTGFLFRQDGHLLYQFTFPDDNLSYVRDLETSMFFTVTDENLNYHIARNVVFYNNFYYFVSLKGGNLYEFGTQYTSLEYSSTNIHEIPRIRICPPFRLPTQRMFIIKSIGFTIENGQPNAITTTEFTTSIYIDTQDNKRLITQAGNKLISQNRFVNNSVELASEAVDLSISRDGAANFGSSMRLNMNPTGKRKSRFIFQRLGQANDCTVQLRFWGFDRFVVADGVMEVYQ